MLNREDFDNDKVDAGEVGSGATVTALYEIVPSGGPARDRATCAIHGRAPRSEAGNGSEYGFVKIRYKQPNVGRQPVDLRPRSTARPKCRAFARRRAMPASPTGVAAFAELLRGGKYAER